MILEIIQELTVRNIQADSGQIKIGLIAIPIPSKLTRTTIQYMILDTHMFMLQVIMILRSNAGKRIE